MTQETEGILDRRRLRRKVGLWRSLAVVALVLFVGALAYLTGGAKELVKNDQIARIAVTGMITEDRKQIKLLKSVAEADHVKGVILYVNSPGGTTTGGEALFRGLRDIAAKKPIVAQFGTIATSAAYIAGLGTDHIVARGNSITGSVGVIMQWPELTGLLDKLGVKMNQIKSGNLKAEPTPFKPLDEENRSLLTEMITESHQWFISLVTSRRKIRIDDVPGLRAGRVYSGREALRYKLVDEIGGEEEAVKYLTKKANLAEDLKVIDWKPKKDLDWPFPNAAADYMIRYLGGWLGESVARLSRGGAAGVDGLVSLWQPAKN